MKTIFRSVALALISSAAMSAVAQVQTPAPAVSIRDRYDAILARWEQARRDHASALSKAKTKSEREAALKRPAPDRAEVSKRLVDLAESDPTGPVSRDALLWVLEQGVHASDWKGPYAVQIGRAVDLLLRHHSDDLAVARSSLLMDNLVSRNRDTLITGLVDRAKRRDVKGTATLAKAHYLEMKAQWLRELASTTRPYRIESKKADEKGNWVTVFSDPVYEEAYEAALRGLDPDVLDLEAHWLFEEVVAEYSDVPYVRGSRGQPTGRTLGQEAQDHFDGHRTLTIGTRTPKIDQPGIDDNPLRLSDYRGKVVVLFFFWDSDLRGSLERVPDLLMLEDRFRDKPFAVLGVSSNEYKEEAREVIVKSGIFWPNWFDDGSIGKRFRIRTYPSVIVIDADGIVRDEAVWRDDLEKTVEVLVNEATRSKKPDREQEKDAKDE